MVQRAVGFRRGPWRPILVSAKVREELFHDVLLTFKDLGEHRIKWMDAGNIYIKCRQHHLMRDAFHQSDSGGAAYESAALEIPFVNRTASLQALEDYYDHAHVVTCLGRVAWGKVAWFIMVLHLATTMAAFGSVIFRSD